MQKYKNILFLTLLMILFTPFVTNAYNYPGYKWSSNGTTVDSGDISWPIAWISPLANSMSTWNNAGSSFRFSVGSGHKFTVGSISSGAVATTYTSLNGSTITNSNTVFNQNLNFSTTGEANKYDVQNVATHELGHWLYLGDLYGGGDTLKTMYGSGAAGETLKRTLEPDDINGIRYIYP